MFHMEHSKPKLLSNWEETLALQIRALRLPVPSREFRFDDTRRWRFDFAYPEIKLAIEVDGGTWTQGRHTRGQGYENDAEKCNQAVLQGGRS
jgi:very-short-patch-repair endonuclease